MEFGALHIVGEEIGIDFIITDHGVWRGAMIDLQSVEALSSYDKCP